jgi:hypothetical protein
MEVKDIINEGRPVEPYSFETDNEVTWYKIGANDGYAYALEEFENNRLKACESQTEAEAERELNFAIKFFEEHHRQPTFSDAIEATRKKITVGLFNDLKRILPKHIFLSFDGILMVDWDKLHQEFIECGKNTLEE